MECKTFEDLYARFERFYPELLEIEGISRRQLDSVNTFMSYIRKGNEDTIDANANVGNTKSYPDMLSEMSKSPRKYGGYRLIWEALPSSVRDIIIGNMWRGEYYLHDATNVPIPYCMAASTERLVSGFENEQLESRPPKRLESYIRILSEWVTVQSNNIAGALAIADLFAISTHMLHQEGKDPKDPANEKYIVNCFQSLVHTVNNKLRCSHQSPFTNVSVLDRPNIKALFEGFCEGNGLYYNVEDIIAVEKIFVNFFKKGDHNGTPYRFPVVVFSMQIDAERRIIDEEFFKFAAAANVEKGNFNWYIADGAKLASCCRLLSDRIHLDTFGNGGLNLGSARVITLNMARLIADPELRVAKPEEHFEWIAEKMREIVQVLVVHRKIIADNPDIAASLKIVPLKRLFSTIGINGFYELIETMAKRYNPKMPLLDAMALWGERYQDVINACIKEANDTHKGQVLFNCEMVPGETLSASVCKKDVLMYGDYEPIRQVYANQLPMDMNIDVEDRIKFEGRLLHRFSGGAISHINFKSQLTNADQMEKVIRFAVACHLEHFAINYTYQVCANNHTTIGQSSMCPTCNTPIVDRLTRIVGYFVRVSQFNKARQREYGTRKFY